MDMFAMIKNSIGGDEVNPITKYFDIGQHVASCGPEMVWKIHDAVRLDDNKVTGLLKTIPRIYRHKIRAHVKRTSVIMVVC